jgi:hypothetical protein
MRLRDLAFFAACAAWTATAAAQSPIPSTQGQAMPMPAFEAEFDDDTKSWKEIQAQLPPPPKPENLARVRTGSATSHQFFVDTASISVGADGVTRFTVVVKTTGGATNVTFEGMRCETREQKLYAIGHSDKTWVRARDTKWQRVVLKDLTPHHYTLYHDFFCPSGTRPTPVRQAVNALRRGYGFNQGSAAD